MRKYILQLLMVSGVCVFILANESVKSLCLCKRCERLLMSFLACETELIRSLWCFIIAL